MTRRAKKMKGFLPLLTTSYTLQQNQHKDNSNTQKHDPNKNGTLTATARDEHRALLGVQFRTDQRTTRGLQK